MAAEVVQVKVQAEEEEEEVEVEANGRKPSQPRHLQLVMRQALKPAVTTRAPLTAL